MKSRTDYKLTPRYTDAAYWRLERMMLGEEFTDITMQILLAGADAGLADMPDGLDITMDWDVYNEAALDWMKVYFGGMNTQGVPVPNGAYSWANNLTEVTRKRVTREIGDWIVEGAPLPVLEDRLKPVFGERRARMVAVTEVTRTYAAGNIMAWKATGIVSGKRWMTAVDERVCPICGSLHNTIVEIDNPWQFTQEMIDANPQLARIMKTPAAITVPPAHVLCRCWLQPVIFEAMEPEEIAEQSFGDAPVSVMPVAEPTPITAARREWENIPDFKTVDEGIWWIADNLETKVYTTGGERVTKKAIRDLAIELKKLEYKTGYGLPADVWFNNQSFRGKEKTVAFYSGRDKRIFVRGNPKSAMKKYLGAKDRYSRSFVGDTYGDVLQHEFAHAIDDDDGRVHSEFMKRQNVDDVQKISFYATSDWEGYGGWGGAEAFAEAATAYVSGKHDLLTGDMIQYMKRIYRR